MSLCFGILLCLGAFKFLFTLREIEDATDVTPFLESNTSIKLVIAREYRALKR